MTEHMLAGAETARTIVTQIDRIKLPLHLLMLFYSGLLAHLAGVLSTRIGAEPTEKLLDQIKGSLPRDGAAGLH